MNDPFGEPFVKRMPAAVARLVVVALGVPPAGAPDLNEMPLKPADGCALSGKAMQRPIPVTGYRWSCRGSR